MHFSTNLVKLQKVQLKIIIKKMIHPVTEKITYFMVCPVSLCFL
jgi:hypothetical protein